MLNKSGLTVTGDKILVKLLKVEEKTAGGIILPEQVKDKEQLAQKLGVLVDWGSTAAMDPQLEGIGLGEVLVFPRYSGDNFPIDGEDYWIMRASAVLGKATRLPDYVLNSATSTLEEFGANA